MLADLAANIEAGPAALVTAWLLNYLVHSTLLLGAAFILSRVLAGKSDLLADRLWKVALMAALFTATLPVIVGIDPLGGRLHLAAAQAAPVAANNSSGNAAITIERFAAVPPTGVQDTATTGFPVGWLELIVLAWAAGVTFFGVRFLRSRQQLNTLLRDRREITSGPLVLMLGELQDKAAVQGYVSLSASPQLTSPLALSRSEICLPERAISNLTIAQQRSMLAHELAHIARRDPEWLQAAGLLEAVFFFQPLNRLGRRRMQELSEYICDDWAVQQSGDGLTLARCLLEVAGWVDASRQPALVPAMVDGGSPLLRRVQRILAERRAAAVEKPRRRWMLLLAGLPLLVAFATPTLSLHGAPAKPQVTPTAVATPASGAQPGAPGKEYGTTTKGESAGQGYGSTMNENGNQISFSVSGDVTFSDDGTSIASIAAGGSVTVEQTTGNGAKKVVVTPDGKGGLSYAYTVDGKEQAFDAAASAWLADLLPQLVQGLNTAPAFPGIPGDLPPDMSGTGMSLGFSTADADGNRIEGKIEGDVQYNAANTDVASIGDGGSFSLEEKSATADRKLVITPAADGSLARTYTVDGVEQAYDSAASAWLAALLPNVVSTMNNPGKAFPALPGAPAPNLTTTNS